MEKKEYNGWYKVMEGRVQQEAPNKFCIKCKQPLRHNELYFVVDEMLSKTLGDRYKVMDRKFMHPDCFKSEPINNHSEN